MLSKSETWGLGAAKLVARSTRASTEVIVSLSDFHYPHHDTKAVESAFNLVEAIQPHRLALNGDLGDYFTASSHNKAQTRMDSLQSDVDGTNSIRAEARRRAPNALIDEAQGNHDAYITKFIREKAQVLGSLRNLNPDNLFAWEENEITPHGRHGFRVRPHFLIKHGDMVRGEGGATAKAEYFKSAINGVSGHTHRLDQYVKTGYKPQEWYEQGCLCRLDPDYIEGVPNWRHGLAVIHLSTKTDNFKVELVSTFNGRFTYGGKTF